MGMMINRCGFCGSSDVDVLRSPLTNRYHVECWSCGETSSYADTKQEAIEDWNREARKENQNE